MTIRQISNIAPALETAIAQVTAPIVDLIGAPIAVYTSILIVNFASERLLLLNKLMKNTLHFLNIFLYLYLKLSMELFLLPCVGLGIGVILLAGLRG